MIPGIEKYPDLKRKLEYELSRKTKGCARCEKARIRRRYAKLVREREEAEKYRRRPGS